MSKYSSVSNTSDELIVVRSEDYSNSPSNFNVLLLNTIKPNRDEHLELSIHTAEIPMSYYIINSNNRSFTISANYNSVDYSETINLPIGNPQATTGAGTADVDIQQIMAAYIQAFIDDNSLPIDDTTGSIDEYTGIMNFTFGVAATIGYTLNLTINMGTNTSLQRILGLSTASSSYQFLVGDAGNDVAYDFDTIVNCGGLSSIYIRSDIANGSSYETRTGQTSNILGQVVIDTSNFSYALIRPFESVINVKLGMGRTLDKFSLNLTDIDGNSINLNGLYWNCVIRIRHMKPSLRENETIDSSGKIMPTDTIRVRPQLSRYIK